DVACKRSADAINQGERGSQQAQLQLVQVHFPFQKWKYGENGLAVCVIEKAAKPEHCDYTPLIVGGQYRNREYGLHRAPPPAACNIRARHIGRTLSAIQARICCPSGVSCGAEMKSNCSLRSSSKCEASTGQATPISAVTGRLPSSRANPDISMR